MTGHMRADKRVSFERRPRVAVALPDDDDRRRHSIDPLEELTLSPLVTAESKLPVRMPDQPPVRVVRQGKPDRRIPYPILPGQASGDIMHQQPLVSDGDGREVLKGGLSSVKRDRTPRA